MVHRAAPLRLTGAFGVMLLVAGVATIVRHTLAGDTPAALIGSAIVVGVGGWVLTRRDDGALVMRSAQRDQSLSSCRVKHCSI